MVVPPLGTVPMVIVWVVPFGSAMVAVVPAAALGPVLVTVTVTVMTWPGVPFGVAVKLMRTSATAPADMNAVLVLLAKLSSGQLVLPVLAATVVVPAPTKTEVTEVTVELGARVTGANVVVKPLTTSVGVNVAVIKPGLLNVTVADTVLPCMPLAGSATEMPTSAGGTMTPDRAAAVGLAVTAKVGVYPPAMVKATPLPPA